MFFQFRLISFQFIFIYICFGHCLWTLPLLQWASAVEGKGNLSGSLTDSDCCSWVNASYLLFNYPSEPFDDDDWGLALLMLICDLSLGLRLVTDGYRPSAVVICLGLDGRGGEPLFLDSRSTFSCCLLSTLDHRQQLMCAVQLYVRIHSCLPFSAFSSSSLVNPEHQLRRTGRCGPCSPSFLLPTPIWPCHTFANHHQHHQNFTRMSSSRWRSMN